MFTVGSNVQIEDASSGNYKKVGVITKIVSGRSYFGETGEIYAEVLIPGNKISIAYNINRLKLLNDITTTSWDVDKASGLDLSYTCDFGKLLSPIKNKKEEKNYMKILEIYKKRRLEEISEKYKNERQEIQDKDAFKIIIDKSNKELIKAYEAEGFKGIYTTLSFWDTTETTKKAIDILEEKRKEEEYQLLDLIEEIESRLMIAETYDQKMDILKIYNIIDNERNRIG